MDAVTLINQNLNIERLLEHYDFDHIKSEGEIIRSCCKLHEGNNPTAFAINQETGLWFCHTGDCGGGDAFTLVQRLEKCDFSTAVFKLAQLFDVDITNLRITEHKTRYAEDLKKFIKLFKKNKKKIFQSFTIEEPIREVTKYRNFTEDTIKHFQLGYVESVKLHKRNDEEYSLQQRLVFPIIFDGIQIGLSFRRIKSTDYPRWSHQPAHFVSGDVLYNYDDAKSASVVVICEGMSDVWAFHEIGVPAVATFGAHITNEQYKLLLKTGADLVLAYDGDEAGRNANQKAITMLKNKANISILRFNEGEDPENISREELKQRYDGRKKL